AGDAVTPEDHARQVYERAGAPKRLVTCQGTTHYRAQDDCRAELADEIASWCDRHLRGDRAEPPGAAEERVVRANAAVA
nr:hypothetical protein [Solirubrobacterales bacterium]